MARSLTQIRDEIERATAERADVWRKLSGAGWPANEPLVERRAELDKLLRDLWDELREARCKTREMVTLDHDEAVRLVGRVHGLALA